MPLKIWFVRGKNKGILCNASSSKRECNKLIADYPEEFESEPIEGKAVTLEDFRRAVPKDKYLRSE